MGGRKTSSKLQRNVIASQKRAPQKQNLPTPASVAPVVPKPRGPPLSFRASVVEVVREIDQFLSMDTLIFFVEAVVELFILSFRFAFQQPVRKFFPTPAHRSTRHLERSPIWKKVRQPNVPKQTRCSERFATPLPQNCNTNSDTGRVPLGTRPLTPLVQSGIHSVLPPPPSIPTLRLASLPTTAPRVVIVSSCSSTTSAPITDGDILPRYSPEPQKPSLSLLKSPRRKPVPSTHIRRSSTSIERNSIGAPEPPTAIITADPLAPQSRPEEAQSAVISPQPEVSALVSIAPPIARKSSAKFRRPPLSQPGSKQQDIAVTVIPGVSSESPDRKLTEEATESGNTKPVVRKGSAKFARRTITPVEFPSSEFSPNPDPSAVLIPPHQPKITYPTPSYELGPVEEQPETIEPVAQNLVSRPSAVLIPPHQPKITYPSYGLGPVEGQPETIEPVAQNLVSRPSAVSVPLHQTEPIYPEPTHGPDPIEEQTNTIEPVAQNLVPQPKFSFPPQPAIAIVQAAPPPPQSPILDNTPPLPSFPELPSLIPVRPRQPPPPPSIPRFPSPQKPVSSSPVLGSDSVSQGSSLKSRHSLMAAVTSDSEDLAIPAQKWNRPETSYESIPQIFRPGWDPASDENIFSSNQASIPKAVVEETSSCRFSVHGSIASNSSADSPPRDESGEFLSSANLPDRARHGRTVSSNPQYIHPPLPSPRARPHSAGSLSSGSEYVPPAFLFDNTHLKPGNAAALLSHAETLQLYRQNAKKAVDNPATQYEFAIFMMDAAREAPLDLNGASPAQREELLKEGLSILRRLADRGYPQAQYYLADCYSNGIGCKHDAPDLERAFPLFVLAAKHGHVEASFRTALAYENAWGCRRDPLKAVQFLRKAASANHPGAMLRLGKACLNGEFGMPSNGQVTLEGINWLKRAAEAATVLYPNAPYELALLHETGYKDVVFPDEAYAVELFAKASDLGHPDAAFRLGEAYEYGRMGCPEDAGLSVHYYSLAASRGNAAAMLSLCAWYMFGAEGVIETSDQEAFAWAQRSAEAGYAKAEFATGYFLEKGVGCRRNHLEAWKYYVRAADHGDERAKSRLKAGKEANPDRAIAATEMEMRRLSMSDTESNGSKRSPHKTKGSMEDDAKQKDKDCLIM